MKEAELIKLPSMAVEIFATVLTDTLQQAVGFNTDNPKAYGVVLNLVNLSIANKGIEQHNNIKDKWLVVLDGDVNTKTILKPAVEKLSELSTYLSGNSPYFYNLYRSFLRIGGNGTQPAYEALYENTIATLSEVSELIKQSEGLLHNDAGNLSRIRKELSDSIEREVAGKFEAFKEKSAVVRVTDPQAIQR